ncbi:hypothetical protein H5410_050839 [Solanum commersonii]|uniref:Uncharacterized protein n=1 Tax=Solanum commersonii TaxID=4109 RepID=A0A9J5WYS6_SOLCO|nr:hypothetical protein H5410_050839 [Solanum commersonii]
MENTEKPKLIVRYMQLQGQLVPLQQRRKPKQDMIDKGDDHPRKNRETKQNSKDRNTRRNKTSRYGRNKTVGVSLLKSEQKPATRAIRKNFISTELMANYCKTIGHKYPDHHCSKCYGEDNIILAVNLE